MEHVGFAEQVAMVEDVAVVVPMIAQTTTAGAPATPRKTLPQQIRQVPVAGAAATMVLVMANAGAIASAA